MIPTLTLPAALTVPTGTYRLRVAVDDDLQSLVSLLSDDPVSASRGDVASDDDLPAYRAGLRAVLDAPGNVVLVVVGEADVPVATMQLTTIPGMARRGATRLLVEAVRVRSDLRSAGIGSAMMQWVTSTAAPSTGARLVQLTSDAARTDAHRFYERLGFASSHVGFKYPVADDRPLTHETGRGA